MAREHLSKVFMPNYVQVAMSSRVKAVHRLPCATYLQLDHSASYQFYALLLSSIPPVPLTILALPGVRGYFNETSHRTEYTPTVYGDSECDSYTASLVFILIGQILHSLCTFLETDARECRLDPVCSGLQHECSRANILADAV